MTIDLSPAGRAYVLAFADDEHMIGSRHANWIGMGPFLEEDLAFCSIAQDELGHALALYEMLMDPADIDRFALLRNRDDYRSCQLAELECPTWDLALVRHWLYDLAEGFRWSALEGSNVAALAQLGVQADREESFHRVHASMYMSRVVSDPGARQRLLDALEEVLPLAGSVWSPPEGEDDAVAEGIVTAGSSQLHGLWRDKVISELSAYDLAPSALSALDEPPAPRSTRSAGFDQFLASLGEVISLDPAAVW